LDFDFGFWIEEEHRDEQSWVRILKSCSDNLKSKIQNRKLAGIVPLVVTLSMCGAVAEAQQPKKIPGIGYLSALQHFRAVMNHKAAKEIGVTIPAEVLSERTS